MQCSAAGRLTPRLLRQGCQLLPARTACAPHSLAGTPRSMSLATDTGAQPQQEQEQQQQQEPVPPQQQQPAPIHIVVNIKRVPQADWAAAAANNAKQAGKGGGSSSDGVKKKVKRNVAMHIGYVGTHYTGTVQLACWHWQLGRNLPCQGTNPHGTFWPANQDSNSCWAQAAQQLMVASCVGLQRQCLIKQAVPGCPKDTQPMRAAKTTAASRHHLS